MYTMVIRAYDNDETHSRFFALEKAKEIFPEPEYWSHMVNLVEITPEFARELLDNLPDEYRVSVDPIWDEAL